MFEAEISNTYNKSVFVDVLSSSVTDATVSVVPFLVTELVGVAEYTPDD